MQTDHRSIPRPQPYPGYPQSFPSIEYVNPKHTDMMVGAVGAAKPYAMRINKDAMKSAALEVEYTQIITPMATHKKRDSDLPPATPQREVIMGMEISQERNRLKSQPVWKVLMILPKAEAILNSKEDI